MTRKRRGSHPERSEIAAQIVKQGGVVIDEPGIYWEIPKANLDAFLERLGVILADQVLADFAAKQREPANPDPCPQTESATYTAADVAAILGIPRSTVYERARLEPERLGVIRLGRSVRFRRTVIDAFVRGDDC
jgi:excisionase family DNA binding protein